VGGYGSVWHVPIAEIRAFVLPAIALFLAKVIPVLRPAELGSERISAVLLEPVLGVAGLFLEQEYLQAVAELCAAEGIHLIVDEITTGTGRLGAMSYSDTVGVRPDILILGKGLTSGYIPLSALAVTEPVYQAAISAWPIVLPHSSTNDGHPAAMAAGLAVLDALKDGAIFQNVVDLGEFFNQSFNEWPDTMPCVRAVSGRG
jgi:adenosylmethionine-8-amino-7-oxononanoate aminotransferase